MATFTCDNVTVSLLRMELFELQCCVDTYLEAARWVGEREPMQGLCRRETTFRFTSWTHKWQNRNDD